VHPRTRAQLDGGGAGDWAAHPRLRLVPVLGYLDMLRLVGHARVVLTDSGGLQKEALFLGAPCVTLRDETEWPETVEAGGNVVTGLDRPRVLEAVARAVARRHQAASDAAIERCFGDGHAAGRIVEAILRMLANRQPAR
jgi:UDP-N-acetylglucosamine 2-epimerase